MRHGFAVGAIQTAVRVMQAREFANQGDDERIIGIAERCDFARAPPAFFRQRVEQVGLQSNRCPVELDVMHPDAAFAMRRHERHRAGALRSAIAVAAIGGHFQLPGTALQCDEHKVIGRVNHAFDGTCVRAVPHVEDSARPGERPPALGGRIEMVGVRR
jgi:hypothetical protein